LRSIGLALCAGLLAAGSAAAQEEGEDAAGEGEQSQRPAPTVRLALSDIVEQARTCAAEEDYDCALETMARTERIRELNSFEQAYILTTYSAIYLELEDYPAAIEAYEKILALPLEELSPAMVSTSLRNLSSLYLQVEPPRARESLETFERWMALPDVTPTSQDWYLKSIIHYQLEEHENGAASIRRAIEMAQANGQFGLERWYELLHVFYYELEDQANVIDTLEILVENWTERQHMIQLAGQLSERDGPGDQARTLTLWEAAYDAGWLEQSNHFTALANWLMAAGAPYKAAVVLEQGLADGDVESTQQNWRMLATAWRMARENDKAIPALNEASSLAADGNLDYELALAYTQLAQYENCVDSAREALDRGGLTRTDSANLLLGRCLISLRRYDEATEAFRAAARDERVREDANRFLAYIETEVEREDRNASLLQQLAVDRAARAARAERNIRN
jgi:tetratricopeptide (TPR) repeat protein